MRVDSNSSLCLVELRRVHAIHDEACRPSIVILNHRNRREVQLSPGRRRSTTHERHARDPTRLEVGEALAVARDALEVRDEPRVAGCRTMHSHLRLAKLRHVHNVDDDTGRTIG